MALPSVFEQQLVTFEKGPGEKRRYEIEWATALGTGVNIQGSPLWSVDPSGELVIEQQELAGTLARVWLSGGVAATTYRVTCQVTTDEQNNPVLVWGFNVKVIDKKGAPA